MTPALLLSQNEQDTRLIIDMLELPLMEPSTPAEAKDMIIRAFELSEEFGTVVIVREIRSFSIMEGNVKIESPIIVEKRDFIREKNRWLSTTFNVLDNHNKLHEKLEKIRQRFCNSEFNKVIGDGKKHCVIASGFSYTKLMDVLGSETDGIGILKLATIHPLPDSIITNFLRSASQVLILEDNEPYVENKVKAICQDAGIQAEVIGKTTGHISRVGETTKEDIAQVLESEFGMNLPDTDDASDSKDGELQKTFCDGLSIYANI